MGKCDHPGDPKACASCEVAREQHKSEEEKALCRTLAQIRHKILVMSGKGGVGKSSVAVALALSLARRGFKVGLMDVDIHGPNVLRMLGLKDPFDLKSAQFQLPPDLYHNLKVISVEAVMRDREIAVIWRGPLKHQLIRQFLTETVVLSSTGGLLGVLLGFLCIPAVPALRRLATALFPEVMASLPPNLQKLEPRIALWSILAAFGISVAVGMLFGLYPARRAAQMDPIEALRHE